MENGYKKKPLIKVSPPKKKDIWTIRFLICCGLISMTLFVLWFVDTNHIGYGPIYCLLTFALLFKLVKMLHEWYHYWSVSVPVKPVVTKEWKVDILTTACPGEPREMIIQTLKAMSAITYPHTSYLCDEGNDPILKHACDELGVVHVTRTIKTNAKAGNINNALQQASGEICVVLDPDHVPVPEFLDRVLPYFENPEIGFVQCVQAYGNQSESLIARGAAEQTYHFYGPMMMCMNTYGTVQAIGANCTFRRSALDSIGGHAPGLAEDMHTAMQLHAKGWKSVYIPEVLSRGLVPATLSAYYQQQLKWSRGTFELLFRTYPSLYKNFTWRQKLHYLCIPLYFLFGLINLIDILIPACALFFAEVPWEVNIGHFATAFIPMCGLSLLIRMFAQRWLLEKHERGLHLAGGILRTATWWIFLIGFVYSVLNIKVPYIPTPKNDEHQNYWKLSIPNLITALICGMVIFYGLSIDWTPYSIAMASYAFINVGMLSVVVLLSQQKTLAYLKANANKIPAITHTLRFGRKIYSGLKHIAMIPVRNAAASAIIGLSILFLSYGSANDEKENEHFKEKKIGGFYVGIEKGKGAFTTSDFLTRNTDIIALNKAWEQNLSLNELSHKQNSIPFIKWNIEESEALSKELFKSIYTGKHDDHLKKWSSTFRSYKEPVFISFAPQHFLSDKTAKQEFILAWRYLYTYFNNTGVSNLTWVWAPLKPTDADAYPGVKFVDWIGTSCLNYGENKKDDDWYSFSQLYTPYRNTLGVFKKPIMITSFGSLNGTDQRTWMEDAMSAIEKTFKEVKGIVFFNGEKKLYLENTKSFYVADFSVSNSTSTIGKLLTEKPFMESPLLPNAKNFSSPNLSYHSKFMKGRAGNFTFNYHNQPWYIKGVAYNTAHDWRDGNMPLSRRQVEKDFQAIKAMGANTIRRYDYGIYDRNILNIAQEYDLKILYGFWFDPKIDYYKDSVKVNAYIDDILEKVDEYKNHPSVLAWSLGNETWGLLKHNYAKPYLTKVRNSYVRLIEHLAQRIHEIDPEHAIFSSMEHEEYQLPGEIITFKDQAPSLDAIGVNSYYKEQIEHLNHITWQFDSLRPYFVSEFGPRGYWDPSYNKTKNGSLIEESDQEKSKWYKEQWKNYISAYKGYNIGGVAYCWHDRMEGSYTWFGLSDYRGRLKPAYYALKETWSNKKETALPQVTIVAPQKLVPGAEMEFNAVYNNNPGYEFEWHLLKDEFLDDVGGVTTYHSGRRAMVHIPETESNYRLYVFMHDQNGNVTTSSVPVKVKKQKYE